jgi:hypothetical protein
MLGKKCILFCRVGLHRTQHCLAINCPDFPWEVASTLEPRTATDSAPCSSIAKHGVIRFCRVRLHRAQHYLAIFCPAPNAALSVFLHFPWEVASKLVASTHESRIATDSAPCSSFAKHGVTRFCRVRLHRAKHHIAICSPA